MKIIKDNMIRIFYIIFSVILILISIKYQDTLLPNYINIISYYGSLFTTIALIVTFCEIIKTSNRTRTIQKEIEKAKNQIYRLEDTGIINEAFQLINNVIKALINDKYIEAYTEFKVLRSITKNYSLFQYSCINGEEEIDDHCCRSIEELEGYITKSMRATQRNPLANLQKSQLVDSLISFKSRLEKRNPARR